MRLQGKLQIKPTKLFVRLIPGHLLEKKFTKSNL